jgi:hypothetical protein
LFFPLNRDPEEILTMKLTALLALLYTFLSVAAAAYVHCEQGDGDFSTTYTVYANDIPNVPGVCGGLWHNIKRFSACQVISNQSCGPGEGYDGRHYDMIWRFGSVSICNRGMVHSAWWEATKNKWGSISCN